MFIVNPYTAIKKIITRHGCSLRKRQGKKKEYREGAMKMVLSCQKWVFLIVMLGFTSITQALELAVINDIPEMIRSKKIALRVDFSTEEKFLYRDMLRFSSSNTKIVLRYWKASVAAKSEYISSFHQTKRVFVEPFDLELTFEGINTSETTLPEELSQTNVIISYVTLNNQQAHTAKTTIVPVSQTDKKAFSPIETSINHIASPSQNHPGMLTINRLPLDDEISYLHQGEAFYLQFGNLIHQINHSLGWIFVLTILLLMLLFGTWRLFKHSNPLLTKYYPAQCVHIILSLTPIAFAYALDAGGGAGIANIILGCYALIIGCYLFITQHGLPRTFKTKCLSIIGSICCVSALPLIIKGLLIMLG